MQISEIESDFSKETKFAIQSYLIKIFPWFDQIVFREALNLISANKMQVFWNFVLHNCIVNFDAEQAWVYLKFQVTNFKYKEVIQNLNEFGI